MRFIRNEYLAVDSAYSMLNGENIDENMPWLEDEINFCPGCKRLQQELDEKNNLFEAKYVFIKEKIKNAHSLITHYKIKNRQFDLHLKKCGEKSKLFDRVYSECTRYEKELTDLLKTLEPLKQENKALSDELRNQNELNQDLEHKLAALEVMCQQYKTSNVEKNHSIKNKLEEHGSLAKEVNMLKTCVLKHEKDLKKAKDEVIAKRTLLKRKAKAINDYQKRESKHKKYLLTFASILEDHKLLAKNGIHILKDLKCEKDPLSISDTDDIDLDHLKLERLLLEEDSNTPLQNLSVEEIFLFYKRMPPILSPLSPVSFANEKEIRELKTSIKNSSSYKQVKECLEFTRHTPSFHQLSSCVKNVGVIIGSHENLTNNSTVAHSSFNCNNSDIEILQPERTYDNSKYTTQHINESVTEDRNPQRNADTILSSKINIISSVPGIIESHLCENNLSTIVSSENSVICSQDLSKEKMNDNLCQKYLKINSKAELPGLNKTYNDCTSNNTNNSQKLQNLPSSLIINKGMDLDQSNSNHLQENKSSELAAIIPKNINSKNCVSTFVDNNLHNPVNNTLCSQSTLELNLNKPQIGSSKGDLKQKKTIESTKISKESKNICEGTNLQLPNSTNSLNELSIENTTTDTNIFQDQTNISNTDSYSHPNLDNKKETLSQSKKKFNLEVAMGADLDQPKTVKPVECLNIFEKTNLSQLNITTLNCMNKKNKEFNILEQQISLYNKDSNVIKTPENTCMLPQSKPNFTQINTIEQLFETNGMTRQQAILNNIKGNEKSVEAVTYTSAETNDVLFMNISTFKHSNENEESGVTQKNKIYNFEKSDMRNIQEHRNCTNSKGNQMNIENITTDVSTQQQSNKGKENSNIQTNTDNGIANHFQLDINEFPLSLEKNSSLVEQQLIQKICMDILSEVCSSEVLGKACSDSFSKINETIEYKDQFNSQHLSKQDTFTDTQNNNKSNDHLMNAGAEATDLIKTKCDVCSEENKPVEPEEDIKAVLPVSTVELDENEINRRLKMFALQLPVKTEEESVVKECNEYPGKIAPIMQTPNIEQPLDLTVSSKNQLHMDTTLLQPKLDIPKNVNIMLNPEFKTNMQQHTNATKLSDSQADSCSLEFEMVNPKMPNRSIQILENPSFEKELQIMQQDKSKQSLEINRILRPKNVSLKLQESEQIAITDNKSNELAISPSAETQIDSSIGLNKKEMDIKHTASKIAIGNEEFDGDKTNDTNVQLEKNESTMKNQLAINSVLGNSEIALTEINRELVDNPCYSCICHVKERDDHIEQDKHIGYVESTIERSGELNVKATDSILNRKVLYNNLEQAKNNTIFSESLMNISDSFNVRLENETINILNKKTVKPDNEIVNDTFKKKKMLESELNGLSLELKKTLGYYNRLSVDVALTNNLPDISLNAKKKDRTFSVDYDYSKSCTYLPLEKNQFLDFIKKESSEVDSQEYDHMQLNYFSNSEKITEHLNEAFKKIAEPNPNKDISSVIQSNYPLEQFPYSIAALSSLPAADLSNVLLTIDQLSPLPPSPPTSLSASFLFPPSSPVLPIDDFKTSNKGSGKEYSSPPPSSLSASPFLLSPISPVIDNKDFCIKNIKTYSNLSKRNFLPQLSSLSKSLYLSSPILGLSYEDFKTKNKKTHSILSKRQFSPSPSSLSPSPFLLSPPSPVLSNNDFQASNKKTYDILAKNQHDKKVAKTISLPISNSCNTEDINLSLDSTDPEFCYKKRKTRHKLIEENLANPELNTTVGNINGNKLLSNKTHSDESAEHQTVNKVQKSNLQQSSKRKLNDLEGLVQKKQCMEIPEPTSKNSESPKGESLKTKKKKVATFVNACVRKLMKNEKLDVQGFVNQLSKLTSICLATKLAKSLQKSNFDFSSTLLSHTTNFNLDKPLMADWELSLVEVLLTVSQTSEKVDLLSLVVKKLHETICKENVSTCARATMCRINVALLRYQGNLDGARILCYDIMYSKLPDSLILLLSIVGAWSLTLQMQTTDNCPVDAVFQLLIFRTSLADQEKFQTALIALCNIKPSFLNANDLTRHLFSQVKLDLTPESSDEYFLNSWNFNVLKAVELLARYEDWEWINNFVIRQLIWPLLQQWSRQEIDNQPTDQQVICSFLMLGYLCKQCPVENKHSVQQIMTTLKLFFNIIMRPHQKVSLPVQLSALEALLQLAPFNPKITRAVCRKWFSMNKVVPKAISRKYEIFKSVFETNVKINIDQAAIT